MSLHAFPHAAGALAPAGQAIYGEGTAAFAPWFTQRCHSLRHDTIRVVFHVGELLARMARWRKVFAELGTLQDSLSYLKNRQD